MGGISREREISLKSGSACFKALKNLGYKVKKFDPKFEKYNNIKKKQVDIIFNSLHGEEGEDGYAQLHFEQLQIPYTHSGVKSSMIAMNKVISKKIFKINKILTPPHLVLNKNILNSFIKLKRMLSKNKISYPVVIKPISEGSSINVFICQNFLSLCRKIKFISKKYNNFILEKYIGGKEIQVAVLNDKPLGAIELVPKRKFYDYKAKYNKNANTRHVMPAEISKKNYDKVLKIASKTHKLFNCRGITRSDFKFYKNKFYLLEINTQPGMTNLSLVPEIAHYKQISFESLVNEIVKDADIKK